MIRQKLSLPPRDIENLWDKLNPFIEKFDAERARLEALENSEYELDELKYKERNVIGEAGFEEGIRFGLKLFMNHFRTNDLLTLRLSDEEGVTALIERMLARR